MDSKSRWGAARGLVVAGLLANVLGHLMVMTLEANFALPGIIATVVPFVLAVFVWFGPRWLLPVAALAAAFALYGALQSPISVARLSRPDEVLPFLAGILEAGGLLLATLAGLVATYQAYVPRRRVAT